ncbi:MAG: helix-turn-helix domain-containing protein, partial [Bacteroidota bacterium]
MGEKRISRSELARGLGITNAAVTYLLRRESLDVRMLQKISSLVGYNFFAHLTVGAGEDEKDKLIEDLKKQVESNKRQIGLLMQENMYLKKINELLERK